MDPGSIIGITSAVLSFVDFVGKAVSTARELAEAGSIDEYERLGKLTTALEPGITSLQKRMEAGDKSLSIEEKSALQVAEQCKQVGDSIQRLLVKMRVAEPACPPEAKQQTSSVVNKVKTKVIRTAKTGKVALVVLWKKKEAEDLRLQFDICAAQLNAHLIRLASSDVAAKLDILLTKQLPQLSKDVGLVQTKLGHISRDQASFSQMLMFLDKTVEGASETFLSQVQKVQKALEVSNLTLHAINHRRILNSVRFNEISIRYGKVSKASEDTFGWIVEEDYIPDHYDLKISFRKWLATGDGIFHFSGKPGSGKSTLMKFLSRHSETANQLEIWKRDKTLVLGTAFLWRAGTEKQRSMDGIIRSLLYAILDRHREDLIPKAFPQHWSPHSWSPWTPAEDLEVQLDSDEIQSAFETIIGDRSSGFRYFFFIDGIDEFEDADVRKRELASTLLRWTSSNPDNVKICVSSREEPVFIDCLPLGQRIRLHLVTASDIRKAIQTSLCGHENFMKFPSHAREQLIEKFVRASEGVFIWTKLVLDELLHKLEDKQPLEDLHNVLETSPKDLDEFYEVILQSIRSSDAPEALAIFEVLITARAEWADPACLLLLDYSYIRDFIEPKPASNLGIAGFRSPSYKDRRAQLRQVSNRRQAFKDRVHSLFRGMVEVTKTPTNFLLEDFRLARLAESRSYAHRYAHDFNRLEESLSFAHRSAYDFHRRRQGMDYSPSLDVRAAVLYCLTARVRSGWALAGWVRSICQMANSLIPILSWIHETPDRQKRLSYFKSLAEMDNLLVRQQLDANATGRLQFLVHIDSSNIRYPLKSDKLAISVFSVACCAGLTDYANWVAQWPDSWVSKATARIPLLESLCWVEQRFRRDGALVPLIQRLLQDEPHVATVFDECRSPWGTCLILSLLSGGLFDARSSSWHIISAFLQHGAKADVRFWWHERNRSIIVGRFSMMVGGFRDLLVDRLLPEYLVTVGATMSVFEQIKDTATLRGLYLRFGPQDHGQILAMIDKSLNPGMAKESEITEPSSLPPEIPQEPNVFPASDKLGSTITWHISSLELLSLFAGKFS